MPKFVTQYGPKTKYDCICPEESLTIQSEKDNCDMNFILQKYMKTGTMEHVRQYQGHYGEFDPLEFTEAMDIIVKAENMFESVPSQIRNQFENDPTQFMEFVNNPDNKEKMYEMGLAQRPVTPQPPSPVEVKLSQSDLDSIKSTTKNT